ncbi:MAG: formylmethanofuran dehydrogenase subunit E family protein [Dehalococcoidales bacterium]|nr:formylmethanofuran dehydrogenase subunit E family protein [Dehalococcoidales bacterium]
MQMNNIPFSEVLICGRTYDEYIEMIKAFHGHVAPGVVLGGFMVDLAYRNLPEGEYFDAISETRSCLPDAIQLLTPCTVGNGWLRIIDLGRFAISLFEKYTGNGVRIHVDSQSLDNWPEIKTFIFKLKPKKEQNSEALIREISIAGKSILVVQKVMVELDAFRSDRRRTLSICPSCGEGYPKADGDVCLSCQGKSPYLTCLAVLGKKDRASSVSKLI